MQFLGKLVGPQANSYVDLFTQLSSNKFYSTISHIVHRKTYSVSLHVQAKNGSQESVVRLIKMPSMLVVVAVAMFMLQ